MHTNTISHAKILSKGWLAGNNKGEDTQKLPYIPQFRRHQAEGRNIFLLCKTIIAYVGFNTIYLKSVRREMKKNY